MIKFLEVMAVVIRISGIPGVGKFLNHLPWVKEKIRNLEREFFGIEISTIAKNNHGQTGGIRKALDHRSKANCASRVPHSLMRLMRIEEPAEAVGDGLAGMEIVVVGFLGPVGFGTVVKFHWC